MTRATLLERRTEWSAISILARARAFVRSHIETASSPDVAGLVRALVLGDAGALTTEEQQATRGAGLSHVVAVSGMHVTLVVGVFVAMVSSLGRRCAWLAKRCDPKRIARLFGASLAPVYAEFAGGSASAWRAAATASLVWGLGVAGRRACPLAVTSFVVLGAAVACPEDARSPAFVLSVAATAAVLEPRAEAIAAASAIAGLRALVRTSVRACVATAPITAWCFGTFPPLAVAANMVAVPFVAAVLLPTACVHAVAACFTDVPFTRSPTESLCRAFLALASYFDRASDGFEMPPPSTLEILVLGATAVGLLRVRHPAHGALILAVGTSLFAASEAHLRWVETVSGAVRVTFLDVGQGDAALLDLPNGSTWLIDTGGASFGSRADPGSLAIVPHLAARRRHRLDVVVVTHPHPDHYGGFAALVRRVAIGELWDSGQAGSEEPDGPWSRQHRGLLVPVRTPEHLCGHPREVAGARVEVVWPCPRFDPGWDANDNSLVLRVTFGRRRFLFLGDAEAHTERVLSSRVGSVDVVKVGHHGSRTSSTEPLVRSTRPWLAVISAGAGNRHGHPHQEVLARWASSGAHIVRTDRDGSATVWTDGERLTLRTWSGRILEAPTGRAALDAWVSRPFSGP